MIILMVTFTDKLDADLRAVAAAVSDGSRPPRSLVVPEKLVLVI